MCGRAAQTVRAVMAAADLLGGRGGGRSDESVGSSRRQETAASGGDKSNHNSTKQQQQQKTEIEQDKMDGNDNYNMSPGMDAQVFAWDRVNHSVELSKKVWGLVPRGGTPNAPLVVNNMSVHFNNLMFNARSDTLWDKRTFFALLQQGKTCVIALEGFFEWKAPKTKAERKQPYFVYSNSKQRPYLLLAGLWTSVETGREGETLDTFTIVTTDACSSLTWLHHRMPLIVCDDAMAVEWLQRPSPNLLKRMEKSAWDDTTTKKLQWHAVTPKMVKLSFQSKDAILPMPKPATITSFFTASKEKKKPPAAALPEGTDLKKNSTSIQSKPSPPAPVSGKKRPQTSSFPQNKKARTKSEATTPSKSTATSTKKGSTITSFFSPKTTKSK